MQAAEEWLFDPPIIAPAAAAVVGIVLLIFSLRAGDARLRLIGPGVVLLSLLWWVAGSAVATPTEKAEAQTTKLVHAYRDVDWTAFDEVINANTRFADDYFVGQDITRAAQATSEFHDHSAISIRSMSSERDAAGIRIDVRIRSSQQSTQGQSPTTAWRFEFSNDSDGVYLDSIDPLSTPILDAGTVLNAVRRPR